MNEENPISKYNSQITQVYLTTKSEGQYFERKGLGDQRPKPVKIANELIGMLNADGGVLAFGISDNGEIEDLSVLGDQLNEYRKLVHDFIVPPANINLEELWINEKLVFLYHVEQDHERLFKRKDNEEVYRRVADSNKKLNRGEVTKLEYDKTIRRFEEELVEDFDFDDLDTDLLDDYKKQLNYNGDILELLVKRNVAKKVNGRILLKNAAVLLFAISPEKYIPSASLRYIRYEGTEALTGTKHNVVKDKRFESNIPRTITEAANFIRASINDYYFLNLKEGKFRQVPEYPEDAWLEGIVNALCHRSYNIQGNAVYVKHFEDKIEISNSGPLPAQVTVENIKTERYARNPRIARVLENMGYVRQLNEGVNRIYESMEQSMLSEPEYEQRNNNVYLTLRNKIAPHTHTIPDIVIKKIEDDWDILNPTQQEIIFYLFRNHEATKGSFIDALGMHKNTINKNLRELIDLDIIERRSEKQRDPNAKYAFKQLHSSPKNI